MDKNTKWKPMGLILGMAVCAAVTLWGCGSTGQVYLPDQGTDTGHAAEETAADTGKAVSGTEEALQDDKRDGSKEQQAEAAEELCVYICGAVKAPGVYLLPPGSRIADAVDAAGGMGKNACTDYWNLAEPVSDGQMIDVPTKQEAADMRAAGTKDAADSRGSGTAQQQEGAPASGSGQEPGVTADGKININTASKEQLMQIPGVGDTRAENIISYRESSGGFSGIEDIMNVNGIKEGLFAKMKDYISTGS